MTCVGARAYAGSCCHRADPNLLSLPDTVRSQLRTAPLNFGQNIERYQWLLACCASSGTPHGCIATKSFTRCTPLLHHRLCTQSCPVSRRGRCAGHQLYSPDILDWISRSRKTKLLLSCVTIRVILPLGCGLPSRQNAFTSSSDPRIPHRDCRMLHTSFVFSHTPHSIMSAS